MDGPGRLSESPRERAAPGVAAQLRSNLACQCGMIHCGTGWAQRDPVPVAPLPGPGPGPGGPALSESKPA